MPLPIIEPLISRLRVEGRCPKVLALDTARNTGIAILHADGGIGHETRRFSHGDHPGDLFFNFRIFLTEANEAIEGFHAVYYEKKQFIGTSIENARMAFGFEGNLLSWCRLNEIPVTGIANGTIKKWATGNGHADKAQMIAAVKQFGFEPQDHNSADALALLALAMERLAGEPRDGDT